MSLTDIMSNAGLTFYPIVAFALTFAAFAAIVIRAITRSRGEMERVSQLPLAADDPESGPSGRDSARGQEN